MKTKLNQLPLIVAGLALLGTAAVIVGQVPAPPRGGAAPAAPAAAQGRGQAAPAAAPFVKSGTYFKNVTTSTLKELSVDDFIAAMGVMNAALGYDCATCHPGAGSDKVDFAIDTIPQKRQARLMVEMVNNINKNNFNGQQKVTCWTCHHQHDKPISTIALDNLYNEPFPEDTDIISPSIGKETADQFLDKVIAAYGGAQRLATLRSFVATGISVGYGDFGGDAEYTVYATAPNKRTTTIFYKEHPERGESVWTVDGTKGWVKTPRGFLPQYELIGGELEGNKLEAVLSFPGQIKSALTGWKIGLNRTIGDKDYAVLQGNGPNGYLATLYFDLDTHLLKRLVRYAPSPVGRVPVQVDYADYRDVGGIKFPFEYKFSWLDGKYTAHIKDIKTNVTIEASKFGEAALKK